jgi:nitrate/nitrite transport system permease protein
MIVKTVTKGSDSDSAFIISFISVGLCAMWATLVNTAVGVSSVDKDYINVAKVLRLRTMQKIFRIILPSSLPLIFTGLRITLSVAWMVLIAIELLAQSPGLGSFVWEEFQNGSIDSNAKIIVAMFVIGIIGFMLDRIMLTIQNMVTFNKNEGV